MAMLNVHSPVFSACSVLMSLLFAYSASYFYDLFLPDWYFWFPLYAFAFGINLLHCGFTSNTLSRSAMSILCAGILLLVKVIVEGYVEGVAGLWSLNMRERVVREKLGSGLVVMSMFLHLKASHASKEAKKGRGELAARSAESGMVILVAASIGLTVYFFLTVQEHMKF
ncbi:unnamed protein product [Musa acuminata subsp. malaccensis]|uniref:(wild Malaysian banana) hypothetical protein n=1 Tax=Musa acuminata subsp. malaccensis TaxID=214687 RepID=A0A8D7A3C8_MUSAM|nr:unnamed protein product [Musa acuminata subsp. malaccensis]